MVPLRRCGKPLNSRLLTSSRLLFEYFLDRLIWKWKTLRFDTIRFVQWEMQVHLFSINESMGFGCPVSSIGVYRFTLPKVIQSKHLLLDAIYCVNRFILKSRWRHIESTSFDIALC